MITPKRKPIWSCKLKEDIKEMRDQLPHYIEIKLQPKILPNKKKGVILWHLWTKIEAPKGTGTKFLNKICKIADKHKIITILDPAGKSKAKDEWKGTTSKKRLIQFYKRFQFKPHHMDENLLGTMHRLPN